MAGRCNLLNRTAGAGDLGTCPGRELLVIDRYETASGARFPGPAISES